MATKSLGRVSIVPQGDYDENQVYKRLDLVKNSGKTYLSLKEDNTSLLEDEDSWMLLTESGRFEDLTPQELETLLQPLNEAVDSANQATDAANEAAENALLGISGEAKESNSPEPTGFHRYIVTEPITTGSAWGVEVTQAELDDNWIFFNVKDGVITKDSKPNLKGADGENKIPDWSPLVAYTADFQVIHIGSIWESESSTTAGQEPGMDTVWVLKTGDFEITEEEVDIMPSSTVDGALKDDGTIITGFAINHSVYDLTGINKISFTSKNDLTPVSEGGMWAAYHLLDGAAVTAITATTENSQIEYTVTDLDVTNYDSIRIQIDSTPGDGLFQTVVKHNASTVTKLSDRVTLLEDNSAINHWDGKTWYAYGTSITGYGKYTTALATIAGLTLENKGVPGGGIGNLGGYSTGQVRAAVMNVEDGKLSADLITLEVGPNDTAAGVPLGTIYDTTDATLCGSLNLCIRYLQANTNAQIVVIASVATKGIPNAADKYYEAQMLFEQVCFINKVYFLNGASGLGYARINANPIYNIDEIHQSDLGGYIFAKYLWSQLKNIPIWDLTIPV